MLTTIYQIRCDVCNALGPIFGEYQRKGKYSIANAARRSAAADGWRRRALNGVPADLCPACASRPSNALRPGVAKPTDLK